MKQSVLLLYGSLIVGLAVTLFGSFEPLDNSWLGLGFIFNDCSVKHKYYTDNVNVLKNNNGEWGSIIFENCKMDITENKVTMMKSNKLGTLTITYIKADQGVKTTHEFLTVDDIENFGVEQVINVNNEAIE